MKNIKFIPLILILPVALLIASCAPAAVSAPLAQAPEPQIQPSIAEPVQPTAEPKVIAPTMVPTLELPKDFEGYFLEFVQEVKDFHVPERSQNLKLMYQKEGQVAEIADFCVHGSFWNTPVGVWFITEDKSTVYPSAPIGYKQTVFPHNFVWRENDAGNSYIHAAPWNDRGPHNCPLFISHGCVNMRPDDFDLLVFGGTYTNPFTGQVSEITPIKVGTPFIISPTAGFCTTVEDCMGKLKCTSGSECFEKYTCASCTDAVTKQIWSDLVAQAPSLAVLDNLAK